MKSADSDDLANIPTEESNEAVDQVTLTDRSKIDELLIHINLIAGIKLTHTHHSFPHTMNSITLNLQHLYFHLFFIRCYHVLPTNPHHIPPPSSL